MFSQFRRMKTDFSFPRWFLSSLVDFNLVFGKVRHVIFGGANRFTDGFDFNMVESIMYWIV